MTCHKANRYPDRISAELALLKLRRKGKRTAVRYEREVHWCAAHRGWHLTSKPAQP